MKDNVKLKQHVKLYWAYQKSFYAERKHILHEMREKLKDKQTYNFEKDQIKFTYKTKVKSTRQTLKNAYKSQINPQKFMTIKHKKVLEQDVLSKQTTYFEGLALLEKKCHKQKRKIIKTKKTDRKNKQAISDLRIELKALKSAKQAYIKTEKSLLKQEISSAIKTNQLSKTRILKNSSSLHGQRLYKKTMPVLAELSNQKHLLAIRNGFSALIPLIMISSFVTVIRSIPTSLDPNSPNAYLSSYFPEALDKGLIIISTLTMGLMAIGLAFTIAVNLGQIYGESPVTCGLMGFLGFILWVGVEGDYQYLPIAALGSKAIFVAIITSIGMVEIFRVFKKYNITIRMPKAVPPAVANSFISIIPVIIYAMFVLVIRYVLNFDLINGMENILKPVGSLINDNFGAVILIVLLNSFFWWLGIHGSALTGIITYPFWYPAIAQNQEWFNSGMIGPVPNVFPEPYYQWAIWIGGAGSTIGLAFAAIFFSKSKQNKSIGKAVFVPALFNISEPMMFGFPVVLNVFLFIPFMLAPVLLAISSTLLVSVFAVNWVVLAPWSLPAPIGAFLASGNNWGAIVIALVSIVLATLMYIPFYKAYDKAILKEENEKLAQQAEIEGISVRELLIREEEASLNAKNAKKAKRQSQTK